MKNTNLSNITQKWVEILKPFSEDYQAKLGSTDLSRKSAIPQQTISRILNQLLELKLIEYELIGKNKLFHFDLSKLSTQNIFEIIENHKSLKFLLREKEISQIIEELLGHCESIILFGSYASKKNKKDSDVDLIIINPKEKQKISEIIKSFPLEINEHLVTLKEFEKSIKEKNPLAIEILNNHILFGNTSKGVKIFIKNG